MQQLRRQSSSQKDQGGLSLDITLHNYSFANYMPSLVTQKIARTSPADLFRRFAHEPGAVWLDSALQVRDRGRYSLLARKPVGSLTLRGNEISSLLNSKKESTCSSGGIANFLERLSSLVAERELVAVGFVSYEAMLPFVGMQLPEPSSVIPSAEFFLYDKAVRFDHESKSFAALLGEPEEILAEIKSLPIAELIQTASPTTETIFHTPTDCYFDRVSRIKRYIAEGDIYQANLTTRIDVCSAADPYDVYLRLRKLNPAPYCAYFNAGEYQILSSSPERMFHKTGNRLTTAPIKGTIASGQTESERTENRTRLLSSEKDRAELLMIVDLLRNDLGRIARTGSVSVDRLLGTETYSSVIHLVSDISCQLENDVTIRQIFEAITPGGSITGAPKRRAVEIIQSLETVDRSVYTGCIGVMHKNAAEFSIAIRTVTHHDDIYRIHAGGGIVADSDPLSEYDEMMHKAKNLIKAVKG